MLLGLLVLGALGCGDSDGGAEERADLTDALGFLRSDFGLDDSQVRCVVTEMEAAVGAAELDEVAAQMRAIDAGEISIDDLDPEQSVVVTDALTTCAAVSEP